MRIVDTREIEACVCRLAEAACLCLTEDCRVALGRALEEETGAAAFALDTVLKNDVLARTERLPVCQDTGYAVVFLELGQEVQLTGPLLQDAVDSGVRRAYRGYRKSICDPLTRDNTRDNTPAALHVDLIRGDHVRVTLLPKGFGSENMSRLGMLTPAAGRAGILDFITETVRLAGSRPCPPVVVGVGIGGTFDGCALLAKRALLRELGTRNTREDVAALENEALDRINALGIGPQGFGGKVTALDVLCELAPTHIAGLPVAVNLQCHCVRRQTEVL